MLGTTAFPLMKRGSFLLLFWFLGLLAMAHPVPDLPVRADFNFKGEVVIRVEVDPRCFVKDAENEPYLVYGVYKHLEKEDFSKMEETAVELIRKYIGFHFDPPYSAKPNFTFHYTTLGNKPIVKKEESPVVLQAEWKFELPANVKTYQLKASPVGRFSVLFINRIMGEKQDLNVLFPGESSYKLDLGLLARIRKSKE